MICLCSIWSHWQSALKGPPSGVQSHHKVTHVSYLRLWDVVGKFKLDLYIRILSANGLFIPSGFVSFKVQRMMVPFFFFFLQYRKLPLATDLTYTNILLFHSVTFSLFVACLKYKKHWVGECFVFFGFVSFTQVKNANVRTLCISTIRKQERKNKPCLLYISFKTFFHRH